MKVGGTGKTANFSSPPLSPSLATLAIMKSRLQRCRDNLLSPSLILDGDIDLRIKVGR